MRVPCTHSIMHSVVRVFRHAPLGKARGISLRGQFSRPSGGFPFLLELYGLADHNLEPKHVKMLSSKKAHALEAERYGFRAQLYHRLCDHRQVTYIPSISFFSFVK